MKRSARCATPCSSFDGQKLAPACTSSARASSSSVRAGSLLHCCNGASHRKCNPPPHRQKPVLLSPWPPRLPGGRRAVAAVPSQVDGQAPLSRGSGRLRLPLGSRHCEGPIMIKRRSLILHQQLISSQPILTHHTNHSHARILEGQRRKLCPSPLGAAAPRGLPHARAPVRNSRGILGTNSCPLGSSRTKASKMSDELVWLSDSPQN